MASQLSQLDNGSFGPRIGELRTAFDWSFNQVVDWTSFFRQEGAGGAKYTGVHSFDASAWFDDGGALRTTYGAYAGATLPVTIHKDFVKVPNKDRVPTMAGSPRPADRSRRSPTMGSTGCTGAG
jgi:hypothetical protein